MNAEQRATRLALNARAVPYALPAILWLALTLPTIGQGDYAADSAWYSAIGLQAWRTGELWTLMGPPGQPYFNKPPLPFWIHGLILWLLGPSVWAARLPTVIAGLCCVLLTVRLTRAFVDRYTASAAGLVLALTYEFFRRSFEISLDIWQLVFMLGAVTLLTRDAYDAQTSTHANEPTAQATGFSRRSSLLAAGACLGLALLCKPMVALIAIPFIGVWWIAEHRSRALPGLVLVLLGALIVAAPWHLSMISIHGGEFTKQYFGAEVAARAAGEITASTLWNKPWWFYLEQLITTGWAWLALAALGTLDLALGKLRPAARPLARLGLIWFIGWLLVLSIFPDRRDRYAVVLHPSLALLAAVWLDSKMAFARIAPRSPRWIIAGSVAVGMGLMIATLAGARIHRNVDRQWPELFAFLRAQGWPDDARTPALWAAGFAPHRSARIYLEFGQWATPTRNRWNDLVVDPARAFKPGDLLIYHRRDGWTPGPDEPLLWQSQDLEVRQYHGTWAPTATHDPGD